MTETRRALAMPDPELTIATDGELSDAAIEALATLLLDLAEQEQEAKQ